MALSEFSPEIVQGQLLQSSQQRVFVRPGGLPPTLLPDEVSISLDLFDGQRTTRQIAEELYRLNGKVQIKEIFQTLHKLVELELLANGEEFVSQINQKKSIERRPLPIFFRPLFKKSLVTAFQDEKSFITLYWIFSILITAMGIFSLLRFWPESLPSNWMKIQGSYVIGVGILWVVHSAALSLQAAFQVIITFFSSGIFPGLEIAFSPFGLYLKTHDVGDSVKRSVLNRLFYLLVSILSPTIAVGLIVSLTGSAELSLHLSVLLPMYLLVLLDPYRKSQLSHFFAEISSGTASSLLPYLKKRSLVSITRGREEVQNEAVLIVYSTLAIVWSFLAYELLVELASRNLPNLLAAVLYEGGGQKVFAGLILLVLVGFLLYMVAEILSTLFVNLVQPILNPIFRIRNRSKKKIDSSIDLKQKCEVLEKTHLFASLGQGFLERVAEIATPELHKKGSRIIIQGDPANEVYVVASGSAVVEKRTGSGLVQRFTTISTGAVVGESALLKDMKRGADVIALEDILLLQIPRNFFDSVEDEENLKKVMGRIMISQYASTSDLFENVPIEATNLVTELGEVEECQPGQVVIEKHSPSKDFYLLLRGKVEVRKSDDVTATISEGGFFGEVALIANVPRTAQVKTLEKSVLLRLSAESFWKVLSEHLNLALYLETVADLRLTDSEAGA